MTKATHPIPPDLARTAKAGHETSDASVVGIVTFAVVMLGTIAVLAVVIRHQLRDYVSNNQRMDGEPSGFTESRVPPPEPRLQPEYKAHDTLPYEDMAALKQRWAAELATYGPVPGRPDTARIPIDRAIDLFAERGMLTTTAPATRPAERPKPIGGGK